MKLINLKTERDQLIIAYEHNGKAYSLTGKALERLLTESIPLTEEVRNQHYHSLAQLSAWVRQSVDLHGMERGQSNLAAHLALVDKVEQPDRMVSTIGLRLQEIAVDARCTETLQLAIQRVLDSNPFLINLAPRKEAV